MSSSTGSTSRMLKVLDGSLNGYKSLQPGSRRTSNSQIVNGGFDRMTMSIANQINSASPANVGTMTATGEPVRPITHVCVETDAAFQDPRLYLHLKSVLTNSKGETAVDVVRSAEKYLPSSAQQNADEFTAELLKHPGSTWSSYSARRLMLSRLPEESRPVLRADQPTGEQWEEIIAEHNTNANAIVSQRVKLDEIFKSQKGAGYRNAWTIPLSKATLSRKERKEIGYVCAEGETESDTESESDGEEVEEAASDQDQDDKWIDSEDEEEENLVCDCGREFEGKAGLASHMRTCPEADLGYVEMLFCPGCKRSYFRKEGLRLHVAKNHPDLPSDTHLTVKPKGVWKRPQPKKDPGKAEEPAVQASKLQVDDLVWCKYRDYPFWPAKIFSNEKVEGKRILYVLFYGDNTCERIANPERKLRLFRCGEFDTFSLAGYSHTTYGSLFTDAMKKAIADEEELAIKRDPKRKLRYGSPPPMPSSVLSGREARVLARRAGLSVRDRGRAKLPAVSTHQAQEDKLWTESSLSALKSGDLVWYKFRSFPFWPARIRSVARDDDTNTYKIDVIFFGDKAVERVVKLEDNLRAFRCGRFETFSRAGVAHSLGGEAFSAALDEALAAEREVGSASGSSLPGIRSPAVTNAIAAREKEREAQREAQEKSISTLLPQIRKSKKEEPVIRSSSPKMSRQEKELAFQGAGVKNKLLSDSGLSEREQRKIARLMLAPFLEASPKKKSESKAAEAGAETMSASGRASLSAARSRKPSIYDWSRICGAYQVPSLEALFPLEAPMEPPPVARLDGTDAAPSPKRKRDNLDAHVSPPSTRASKKSRKSVAAKSGVCKRKGADVAKLSVETSALRSFIWLNEKSKGKKKGKKK